MYTRLFLAVAALAAIGGSLNAQNQARRMTSVGGGSPGEGKCTIEVEVDGAAEVDIRGDTANLRNLSGGPPRWRRFECTGALPRNPGDFRFAGVDGRGRQELVGDPRNGGPAVIRIEDPKDGSEGYTFDIMWRNGPGPGYPPQGPGGGRGDGRGPEFDRDGDTFHQDREAGFQRDDWRMHLFARIRQDLDHVQTVAFAAGPDRYRIRRAQQELDQLQEMQGRGRYDRRQLNDVVVALQKVVNDNRLTPRDRDVLSDDLNRLQHFRENVREYGVR